MLQDDLADVASPAAGPDTTRIVLLSLMILLPLISAGIVVFAGLRLKALLARIPRIATPAHVDEYRQESALHNVLAGAVKPMLGIANALFVLDLFVFDGPMSDILYSILPSIACILLSLPFRAIEARAMALPCDNEDLRKAFLEAVRH